MFKLGRNKSVGDRSMEEEALARWRNSVDDGESVRTVGEFDSSLVMLDEQLGPHTLEMSFSGDMAVNESPTSMVSQMSGPRPLASEPVPAQSESKQSPGMSMENIRSALGIGTVIEGKLSFSSPVRIDGTLNGEVVSSSMLVVGEHAVVNADVRVGSLVVLGKVRGNIKAEELVQIKAGGHLEGDLQTQRIAVDEGAFFQGRCNV